MGKYRRSRRMLKERNCGNCGKRGRDCPFLPWRRDVCSSHGLSPVGGTRRRDDDRPAGEICWSAKETPGTVARKIGRGAVRAFKKMITDQRG